MSYLPTFSQMVQVVLIASELLAQHVQAQTSTTTTATETVHQLASSEYYVYGELLDKILSKSTLLVQLVSGSTALVIALLLAFCGYGLYRFCLRVDKIDIRNGTIVTNDPPDPSDVDKNKAK